MMQLQFQFTKNQIILRQTEINAARADHALNAWQAILDLEELKKDYKEKKAIIKARAQAAHQAVKKLNLEADALGQQMGVLLMQEGPQPVSNQEQKTFSPAQTEGSDA